MNIKKRTNAKHNSNKKSGQSSISNKSNSNDITFNSEPDADESVTHAKFAVKRYVKTNLKTILIVVTSLLLICAIIQLDKSRKHLSAKNSELIELTSKYHALVNSTKTDDVAKMLEMLNSAAKATPEYIYSTNDAIREALEDLARNALTRDVMACNAYLKQNITETTVLKWCLRDINSNLLLDLGAKYAGNWTITVGQLNRCFTTRNFGAAHRFIFSMSDILFEFLKYDQEFGENDGENHPPIDELDALKRWAQASENKVIFN